MKHNQIQEIFNKSCAASTGLVSPFLWSEHAQDTFIKEYNNSLKETDEEHKAAVKAWQKIEEKYDRDDKGVLSQPKAS